jgi:hypothetical protein
MARKVNIDLSINTGDSEKNLSNITDDLKQLNSVVGDIGSNDGIEDFSDSLNKLEKDIDNVISTVKESGQEIENTFISGKEATEQFSAASIRTLGSLRKELASLVNSLDDVEEGSVEFDRLTQSIQDTEAAISKTEGAFGEATDRLRTLSGSGVERANASFGLLRQGITTLNFNKLSIGLKGLTGSFRVLGAAIAATGIGLLVGLVGNLIQNFDKLKESGGAVGAIFSGIGNIISFVTDNLTKLTDAIGLTDSKTDAATKANKKYEQSFIDLNRKLEDAALKQELLSGKISETEFKIRSIEKASNRERENARKEFLDNILKLDAEKDKVEIENLKKLYRERLNVIRSEENNELKAISNSEKEKAEAKTKADQEARKREQEKREQERQKRLKEEIEAENRFIQELSKLRLEILEKDFSDEDVIRNQFNNKRLELLENFNKLTLDKQKEFKDEFIKLNEQLLIEEEKAIKKSNDNKIKIQQDNNKERLKTFKNSTSNILFETLGIEEQFLIEKNEKLRLLQEQFDALSKEDQITQQEEFNKTREAIEKNYLDKINLIAKSKLQERIDTQVAITKQSFDALASLNELFTTLENNNRNRSEKELLKIQKRQFRRNQILAATQTGINTAESIIKTGANLGYPAAIPFQIGAGIAGGAQIAAILAKKFDGNSGANTSITTPSGDGSSPATPEIPTLQQLGALPTDTTTKVFVTETDITNTINQVQVIEATASFG